MAAILQEELFTLRNYCYFEESSGHGGGALAEKDNNRIKDKEWKIRAERVGKKQQKERPT